ncbi:MAG: hypothetical protein CMF50_01235 [Legionellales bacterium]|nr:hypothetical protein [Legionellales bacterium]|tara:strand:- start:4629 stop:6872 length:2244 start_codon:yes stop_codon:yes gene_type:complete
MGKKNKNKRLTNGDDRAKELIEQYTQTDHVYTFNYDDEIALLLEQYRGLHELNFNAKITLIEQKLSQVVALAVNINKAYDLTNSQRLGLECLYFIFQAYFLLALERKGNKEIIMDCAYLFAIILKLHQYKIGTDYSFKIERHHDGTLLIIHQLLLCYQANYLIQQEDTSGIIYELLSFLRLTHKLSEIALRQPQVLGDNNVDVKQLIKGNRATTLSLKVDMQNIAFTLDSLGILFEKCVSVNDHDKLVYYSSFLSDLENNIETEFLKLLAGAAFYKTGRSIPEDILCGVPDRFLSLFLKNHHLLFEKHPDMERLVSTHLGNESGFSEIFCLLVSTLSVDTRATNKFLVEKLLCPKLKKAYTENHLTCAQQLCNYGLLVNKRDNGLTLLHRAVTENKFKWVQLAIALEADIDLPTKPSKGKHPKTPVGIALFHQYFDLAAMLLDAGATINFDMEPRTPLIRWAKEKPERRQALELLERKIPIIDRLDDVTEQFENLPPSARVYHISGTVLIYNIKRFLDENIAPLNKKVFLVGGAVRDILLGKAPKDYDFVIDMPIVELHEATPTAVLSQAKRSRQCLTLTTSDEYQLDFASIQEIDGAGNFYANLKRNSDSRDFTINALYLTSDGTDTYIWDFHNGISDLKSKLLNPITEDFHSYFNTNPNAFLRAIYLTIKLDDFSLNNQLQKFICDNFNYLYRINGERTKQLFLSLQETFETDYICSVLKDLNILETVKRINPDRELFKSLRLTL